METDAALVGRARTGDKPAFGELIVRHQPMVERVARHMVRDVELARDLAQEALLAAYLSLEHLREDARFASWLYGITLNVCKSHLRSRSSTSLSFEEIAGGVAFQALPFGTADDPQARAESRELHERVLAAIRMLSPENRAATLLFYYDGLTLDEIATLLHISVGAVKGRLHKARARLREELFAVYGEYVGVTRRERRSNMIPVTVADVVRRDRRDEQGNLISHHIVILYDDSGARVLPIWVGPAEGMAIALGVMGEPVQRPLTYEFIARLLDASEAKIEAVRIDSLKGDVFYAVVTLRAGDKTTEIDARPSDAIALAVRTGTPITVSETLMDRAALAIPQPVQLHSPPRGIVELDKKWQAEFAAARNMASQTPAELAQAQQELFELVFGT